MNIERILYAADISNKIIAKRRIRLKNDILNFWQVMNAGRFVIRILFYGPIKIASYIGIRENLKATSKVLP